MKFKLLITLFTICLTSNIFAANNIVTDNSSDYLNMFFSKDDLKKIDNKEFAARMYIKYNAKDENTHLSIKIPLTKYTPKEIGSYEIIADDKFFFPYELNEASKLKLYNVLAGFSQLKNMIYYSRTSGKNETLVLDSYKIDDPKTKKKVDDTVYTEIKPFLENYFTQKDNKFGTLSFKNELYSDGDNFYMINSTLDPLSQLIQINKAGEYKIITFLIYDKNKKGYYMYSVNVIKIRVVSFIKDGLVTLRPTSFSNRLRAASIHFLKLLGIDMSDKLNPWDEAKLKSGFYKTY